MGERESGSAHAVTSRAPYEKHAAGGVKRRHRLSAQLAIVLSARRCNHAPFASDLPVNSS
jgi:hypothetical protein